MPTIFTHGAIGYAARAILAILLLIAGSIAWFQALRM